MKNQPFDLAVDIDESNNNSIATNEQEEDRDEAINTMGGKKALDSDFKNSTFERKQQQMDGDGDDEENNF